MTTAIIGLVLGLFIGWLRLRQLAKNLRALTQLVEKQDELLSKLNVQNSVLTARLNAANATLAELQPVD